MDDSSKLDGLELSEVISVSDDSEASPSNHRDDDVDDVDGEDDRAADAEVQDNIHEAAKVVDQDGGGEIVGSEAVQDVVTGEDERDGSELQCGGSGLVNDHAQHGGDRSEKEENGLQSVECKPGTESLLDQPVTGHASEDVERPPDGVVVQQDGKAEPKPPQNLVFVAPEVDEPRVTLIPTVGYYRPRRSRRGGNRRGGSPAPGAEEVDLVLYPPRGGGRGRGRRCRALGPRGVTPLSLRQFYDSGGRDYVEYLMRHIEAGAGGTTL